jgi:hypothetical protein
MPPRSRMPVDRSSAYAQSCRALSSHGQIHTRRASSRASVTFPSATARIRGFGRWQAGPLEALLRHRTVRFELVGEFLLNPPMPDQ